MQRSKLIFALTALWSCASSSVRDAPGKGLCCTIMLSTTVSSTESTQSRRSGSAVKQMPKRFAPSSWKLPGFQRISTAQLRR